MKMRPHLAVSIGALGAVLLLASGAEAQEALWKTYLETANQASTDQRHASAETLYLAACAEAARLGGGAPLATCRAYLAQLYFQTDKEARGREELAEALALWEAAGKPSVEFASALNRMAGLREEAGEMAEAEKLYTRAVEVREQVHGADSLELITPLTRLAYLLQNQKEYVRAEDLYARADRIARQFPLSTRAEVAALLFTMGRPAQCPAPLCGGRAALRARQPAGGENPRRQRQ